MTRRENLIINMPHPRSKGSTGFPDGVKDTHFAEATYEGAGYRWGMGIDGSETRLCEYRCLGLFDEMTNWYVDRNIPLKHMQAISEARSDIGERGRPPYDALYANGPVNYVKLDRLPTVDDTSPIIDAMKRGDYVVSSGEVLISSYAVEGTGDQRTIAAEVEWTFPLDFVEVVWGDGKTTDRQIIPATDLRALREEAVPHPVQRRRQEVGPVRRVGRGDQRRLRPADPPDDRADDIQPPLGGGRNGHQPRELKDVLLALEEPVEDRHEARRILRVRVVAEAGHRDDLDVRQRLLQRCCVSAGTIVLAPPRM